MLGRALSPLREGGRFPTHVAAWLDGWRAARPSEADARPDDEEAREPDDDVIEDAFAGDTFRREREIARRAWAREASARSRAAVLRPPDRVVPRLPIPAAPVPAATQRLGTPTLAPSEFLDAFRDGAAARDAVVADAALTRELRARADVRRRAAAAIRETANAALRRESERLRAAEEAAALAWHQRQEALRLAEAEALQTAAARGAAEADRAALARSSQVAASRAAEVKGAAASRAAEVERDFGDSAGARDAEPPAPVVAPAPQAIDPPPAQERRARAIAQLIRSASDQTQGRRKLLYQLDAAEAQERARRDEQDLAAASPGLSPTRRSAVGPGAVLAAARRVLSAAGRQVGNFVEQAAGASMRVGRGAPTAAADFAGAATRTLAEFRRLFDTLAAPVVPAEPGGTTEDERILRILRGTEDERILRILRGGESASAAPTGPAWGTESRARLRALARRAQGRARNASFPGRVYFGTIAGLSAIAGRIAQLPTWTWSTAARAGNAALALTVTVATGAIALAIAVGHGVRIGAPRLAAASDVWLWTPLNHAIRRAAPALRDVLDRAEVGEAEPEPTGEPDTVAQKRRVESQRRRAAEMARLDELRTTTAQRADELIRTARAVALAARAGLGPAVDAALEPLALIVAPMVSRFQSLRSLTTGENLRSASLWLWGADEDARVLRATVEDGLEFARRSEERTRTHSYLGGARYVGVLGAVRASAREREAGGAVFLPHVMRREAAFVTRGRRDATDAIAVARLLRAEEAQASVELLVADRQRGEVSARRALADEVRRAQLARETERRRRREEAELDRLRTDAEALEDRAERIVSQERSDTADGVDTALLRELRARLEERQRAVREQAERVAAARDAQSASEAEAAAQRRRRVLAALSVGVGRFRRRLTPEPIDARPGADLSGQSFDERDLAGVDLRAAQLRRSTFVGADLRRADLRDADLTESDFTGARLEGARFDGACLDGAVLDQILVTGATFANVRAAGAQLGAVRGLSAEGRQALVGGGAQTPTAAESGGGRLALGAVLLTIAVGGGFYAYGQFGPRALDAAALEQAAAEARQSGRSGDAADAFRRLSEQAVDLQSRVDYLLEGAVSAEEANDRARTLSLLEEAIEAAGDTQDFPRVLLARADVWQRLGLDSRAATEFEALLARRDISPDQAAASVVGLHNALRDGGQTAGRFQEKRLFALATDPERCAFALALADAWAAADLPLPAKAALEAALASIESPPERAEVQLRLARATAEGGELDAGLALYAALDGSTREEDARLGAAELLERAGRGEEARAMLTPLLSASAADVRARAHLALATTAERAGQNEVAMDHVREALAIGGVPPAISDGARILLARLDPSAVEDLVAEHPGLATQLLLGRAQALREAGERSDARAIWVKVAEDASTTPEARVEATLAIAELQVDDGDMEGAIRRYDALLAGALVDRDTRVRVSLGRSQALLRSNRVQEAEAAYIALLAGASAEVEAQCRLGLANAKELRGQAAAAAELYQMVGRGQGPWALEALLSLGRLRETGGDLPSAIEAYRLARGRPGAEASRRTAADLALAQALDASGDAAGAATVYAALIEAPDTGIRVQARIAVAEARLAADPAAARALLDSALAEATAGPEQNAARALWVRASVAVGDAAGARSRLDAWLATDGDRGSRDELVAASIRALRAEGEIDAAAEVATRWADVGFEAGMEGALSLREAGRTAEAVRVLKDLEPEGVDDRRWRDEVYAELLVEADDLDAADEVWARLQRSDPDAAYLGRARIARMRGEPERALTLLADTRDARAAEERGLAYEALERWDEALSAYASMASSADVERRSAAHVGQARVWLAREDARAALSALAQLSVVDPGYTLTVGQLKGDALVALKRFDEARDVYASLDGDAESRTVGALGLGECALAAGDPRTAVTRFGDALRETSDRYYQADAIAGLVRAFHEAGRGEQALAQFETLKDGYPERPDAIARAQAALNE